MKKKYYNFNLKKNKFYKIKIVFYALICGIKYNLFFYVSIRNLNRCRSPPFIQIKFKNY